MADVGKLDFTALRHRIPAAAPDAWRVYDVDDPHPGYYQFDWLSARHPDLYDRFALSSDGLISELHTLVDLGGLDVVDIGAGTGRSSIGVAPRARRVFAVDLYESVVQFCARSAAEKGVRNVHAVVGDRSRLPLADGSVDVAMTAWAESDPAECYRVLRPGGLLIFMGTPLEAISGELTPVLGTGNAPLEWYSPHCPPQDHELTEPDWNAIPLRSPFRVHDFTYVCDYGDVDECAAIVGRLFGPHAAEYMERRRQATLSWRLRISWARVRKDA